MLLRWESGREALLMSVDTAQLYCAVIKCALSAVYVCVCDCLAGYVVAVLGLILIESIGN